MVREDIVGGLMNALERGESEEEAKQSFLNSSYSEVEINEAISYLRKIKKDEQVPVEQTKKKEENFLARGFIKEVKDIKALRKQETSEMPQLEQSQDEKLKKKILRYSLIGGGFLVLALIIIVVISFIIS